MVVCARNMKWKRALCVIVAVVNMGQFTVTTEGMASVQEESDQCELDHFKRENLILGYLLPCINFFETF